MAGAARASVHTCNDDGGWMSRCEGPVCFLQGYEYEVLFAFIEHVPLPNIRAEIQGFWTI